MNLDINFLTDRHREKRPNLFNRAVSTLKNVAREIAEAWSQPLPQGDWSWCNSPMGAIAI